MVKFVDTVDEISVNGEITRTIDLHTHTNHSDGALSPTQLVEKAAEIGLAAMAVSDHENVDGLNEAIKTGKKLGIEIIPAVEISSYPDPLTEHHILGYFIDYKNRKLLKALQEVKESREKRAEKVVINLNEIGYEITFGDVKSLAKGTIVQPHLAWAVISNQQNTEKLKVDFGEIPDTGSFIRKYLVPGAPAYVARKAISPKEAIDLIHQAGGLAVFAHPCWTTVKKVGDKLLFNDDKFKQIVDLGIDGVEVLAHRGEENDTKICVEHFTALAKKYKLLITGGSDYHGFGSAGKDLGFVDFYLKVPHSILEKLKLRIKK